MFVILFRSKRKGTMFKKYVTKGTAVKAPPKPQSQNNSRGTNHGAGRTVQNTRSNKKGGLSGK